MLCNMITATPGQLLDHLRHTGATAPVPPPVDIDSVIDAYSRGMDIPDSFFFWPSVQYRLMVRLDRFYFLMARELRYQTLRWGRYADMRNM